jgi:two-component system chemotaxis response regulator CheB
MISAKCWATSADAHFGLAIHTVTCGKAAVEDHRAKEPSRRGSVIQDMVGHTRRIVAVGASAGGLAALQKLVGGLPKDFPAPLAIVLHIPPSENSILPNLLSHAGPLPAAFAINGEQLHPRKIYVAPPDHHLLIKENCAYLRRGAIENNMRPAIDPLFRSVAIDAQAGAIALLLSGTMSDGVSGLIAVKRCGGTTIVQDPADAKFPELPQNAVRGAPVDHVVPSARMPELLQQLVQAPIVPNGEVPADIRLEVRIAAQELNGIDTTESLGDRSVLTCPECNGALWEIQDGELSRYRCHVGHAYTTDSLAFEQVYGLDRALGGALRGIDEHLNILRKLAEKARASQLNLAATRWGQRIAEYEKYSTTIRDILLARQLPTNPEE